jgi:hypothetical protein
MAGAPVGRVAEPPGRRRLASTAPHDPARAFAPGADSLALLGAEPLFKRLLDRGGRGLAVGGLM